MSRRASRARGAVHFIESESSFTVRFRVPFPVQLKDRVKGVYGSRWHAQSGCWLVPESRAGELLAALHGESFELSEQARALLVEAAEGAELSLPEVQPTAPRPLSPIEQEALKFRERASAAEGASASESATPPLQAVSAGSTSASSPASERTLGAASRASASSAASSHPSARVDESGGSEVVALQVQGGRRQLRRAEVPAELGHGYPSVRSLLQRAESALRRVFGRDEWVVGVAQSVVESSRGHIYLRLMDAEELDEGSGSTALDVAIFGAQAQRVRQELQEHQLRLEEGMTLALRGELKVYAPKSALQFVARGVDARVSRGEVELQRDRVVAAIQAKGLSHRNLRHELPLLPQRIALLTSGQGEALHDVMRTLAQGRVGASVELFHVTVQGPQLEESVVRALHELELRRAEFDVVLIVRGGGAANELAWWDNLAVCEAIAMSSLPVIVGIGHDRDTSALHEVARFEATPTAVAQVMARYWSEARQWCDESEARITAEVTRTLEQAHLRHAQQRERFHASASRPLRQARLQLRDVFPRRVHDASQRALAWRREGVDRHASTLRGDAQRALEQAGARLGQARSLLSSERLAEGLTRASARLESTELQLTSSATKAVSVAQRELSLADGVVRASDPARWLARGYAIVRDEEGRVVLDALDLEVGDALDVRLARGRFRAAVLPDESVADSSSVSTDEHD